jgi:hypothetical protein
MTRAIRLLGLKDTLMIISAPDLSTVQAVRKAQLPLEISKEQRV